MRGRTWKLVIYIFLLGFILNLAGIVSHVVVSAFAKRWFGKPLPPAFTTDWFTYAWTNFELGQVLFITLFIALAVVFIALAIGFPAAYILARRNFRAKPILLLLYFLPLLIPQMTYGIPLATTLYKFGIGATVLGVILAVLVPMVPLAVFILLPFFEQISLNLEWSASMLGASRLQAFFRITLPLSLPGILAAFLFVFIPTLGEFVTPSLVGGPSGYMYGNQIVDLFATGFPDWQTGSVLALFLLGVVALLTLVFARFLQGRQVTAG